VKFAVRFIFALSGDRSGDDKHRGPWRDQANTKAPGATLGPVASVELVEGQTRIQPNGISVNGLLGLWMYRAYNSGIKSEIDIKSLPPRSKKVAYGISVPDRRLLFRPKDGVPSSP